jgi:hypothetical protein
MNSSLGRGTCSAIALNSKCAWNPAQLLQSGENGEQLQPRGGAIRRTVTVNVRRGGWLCRGAAMGAVVHGRGFLCTGKGIVLR